MSKSSQPSAVPPEFLAGERRRALRRRLAAAGRAVVQVRRTVPFHAPQQSVAQAAGRRQRRAGDQAGGLAHRAVQVSLVRGRARRRRRRLERHAVLRHHGRQKARLLEAVRRPAQRDQGHQPGAARSAEVRLLPDRRRHERAPARAHARSPRTTGGGRTRVRPCGHDAALPHHVDAGEQGRVLCRLHRVRSRVGAGRADARAAERRAARPRPLRLFVRLEHRPPRKLPADAASGLRRDSTPSKRPMRRFW